MQRVRHRQPRHIKERHKEEVDNNQQPNEIISIEMCQAVLQQCSQKKFQTQQALKFIKPLLEMDCNKRSQARQDLRTCFGRNWQKWGKCQTEWLHRNKNQSQKLTMRQVVESFRPQKQYTANQDEFFSTLYEQYVEVLLYWEQYIKSLKKKEFQIFFEQFYRQIDLLIDQMDLPFNEETQKKK